MIKINLFRRGLLIFFLKTWNLILHIERELLGEPQLPLCGNSLC